MKNPLSDKIVNIQPSGIRKFFDIVNEMKDAISLGVGEPDFDTPWISYTDDEGNLVTFPDLGDRTKSPIPVFFSVFS